MSLLPPKPFSDDRPAGIAQIDQRSREIFRRLVDTYLDTGEPVGSRTISRILPTHLSPASVRNVMSDLEQAGLIYSPHTSAGRVPTEAGLRFFVDSLLEIGSLTPDERARIDAQVAVSGRPRRAEDVLSEATTLLSGLSHCAGVVLTPKLNARLKHIEFVNLGPNRALVILVGEDGSVENRTVELPAGLPPAALIQASNYLSSRFQGKTLSEVQRFVRDDLESFKRELDDVSARVIEAGIATWSGSTDADNKMLIVRGQANLIENATALEDLERVRRLFEDIENQKELIQLLGLAEAGEGVRIYIGSENKLFSLSGSSIIIAPYRNTEEKIVGVLGVIGPTRLNYARIVPMVDYTARVIGRLIFLIFAALGLISAPSFNFHTVSPAMTARPDQGDPSEFFDPQEITGEEESAGDERDGEVLALQEEVGQLKDRLLRTLAEMENLRKRSDREKAEATLYAATNFARDILSVSDNMSKALELAHADAIKDAPEAVKNLVAGVEVTNRELLNVFERHGIKRIDPKGDRFDPNVHEAMFEIPSKDHAPGTIIDVMRAGFSIGDRLLRPALVGVAKAP